MAFDLLGDIKALLIGITSDIYGEFPADKDNCISIGIVSGANPEHNFSGGDVAYQKPALTHPRFQIAIRHLSAATMSLWWDQIINILDGKVNYTRNSVTYLIIEQQGDIIPGDRDNNRRHVEYLNFNTTIINAR